MKLPVSVIILTHNEELNLENCLKSLIDWAEEIFVVDSYSTDKTLEIAKKYGAKIFQHEFINYAKQFNWALDNLPLKGEWVLRFDADEQMLPELWQELAEVFPRTPSDITGFYIKRRMYFMGRWIKHGGYYPTWILRLWRRGIGRLEDRQMDEHVILSKGRTLRLKNDFIDYNLKDLTFWINKHNWYATREMQAIVEPTKDLIESKFSSVQAERRRWLKHYVFLKTPIFYRAFLYFFYRYFLRLGFLDGKEGLIFHFLSACWYRFLIDAKIYEYKKNKKKN